MGQFWLETWAQGVETYRIFKLVGYLMTSGILVSYIDISLAKGKYYISDAEIFIPL